MISNICLFLLLANLYCLVIASPTKSSLPIVDLGYELHQASSYNESAGFYNFSNIRYAAPPVGQLRFAAPQAPATNRSQIQNGSPDRICPQAGPSWSAIQSQFIVAYLTGQPFNASAASSSSAGGSSAPNLDPRTTEDCLFLDMLVPKKILDNAKHQGYSGGKLAPVMLWVYGGGYTAGEKSTYNGAGLLSASQNGVIFIAINYRLGALGWSSGPSFQSSKGTANAGLHDQRFALEWVQKYIHLFGGDKDRVTLFGESAGGGSVMHQVTAYGGEKGPVPFQAAIPQSPGFTEVVSATLQEQTFQDYLDLLNVSTLDEARQLSSSAVITANAIQVAGSPYGRFTYGPVVDGIFAPALPGQLLLYGAFDHSVRIMTGHNADEGLDFTPYFLQNNTAVVQSIQSTFPGISSESVDYITQVLYPPVYDGSYGYRDTIARAALYTSENFFTCNDNYLARAFQNRTYAYEFTIPPALHGQDVPYTFNNGGAVSANVRNLTVARVLQEFVTSFAITGRPSSATWGQQFPEYGSEANIVSLNLTSISVTKDDTANPRCYWFQKGLFN